MLFTYDHYAEKLTHIASVTEANKLIEERFSFHGSVTPDGQRSYRQRGFESGVTKMILAHKGLVFRDLTTEMVDTIMTEECLGGGESIIGGFFDRHATAKQLVFVIERIILNQTSTSFYGIYEAQGTINTAHRKAIIDDMLETL